MRNIAFAGKACSGKTTAAEELVAWYGYQRVSLADPLRRICACHQAANQWLKVGLVLEDLLPGRTKTQIAQVFGQIMEEFWRIDCMAENAKPRELLQAVGTDVLRAFDEDVWVDALLDTVLESHNSDVAFAVDDVRFRNELYRLQDEDPAWFIVYCTLPEPVRAYRYEVVHGAPVSTHISETDLDSVSGVAWDYILDTSGTTEDLPAAINEMMKELIGPDGEATPQ